MNYLQSQAHIYVHALLGMARLVRIAPLGWLMIAVFVMSLNLISLLTFVMPPMLGYMFLLHICVFIGVNHVAHTLSEDLEYLYQNRSIDPLFTPFRADERFFGFTLGLCVMLGMVVWAIVLHHLYQAMGSMHHHDTLPDFLFHTMWRNLLVFVPMLWLWFAPSYHIHRGDNPIYAMAFSVLSCLQNAVSYLALLGSLMLPLLWLQARLSPIYWLPLVSVGYLLLGVASYVHFRAIVHFRTES